MEANIAYLSNQCQSAVAGAFVDYLEKIKSKDRTLFEIAELKKKIMDDYKERKSS